MKKSELRQLIKEEIQKVLKTPTMDVIKVKNGLYKFNGIDNWTNKPMSGEIIYNPIDKALSKAWEVRFDNSSSSEYFGKSLKDCINWLTN
jgi:hypothetical protein